MFFPTCATSFDGKSPDCVLGHFYADWNFFSCGGFEAQRKLCRAQRYLHFGASPFRVRFPFVQSRAHKNIWAPSDKKVKGLAVIISQARACVYCCMRAVYVSSRRNKIRAEKIRFFCVPTAMWANTSLGSGLQPAKEIRSRLFRRNKAFSFWYCAGADWKLSLRFSSARFCKSNAHRIMIITAQAEKSLVSEKELECSYSGTFALQDGDRGKKSGACSRHRVMCAEEWLVLNYNAHTLAVVVSVMAAYYVVGNWSKDCSDMWLYILFCLIGQVALSNFC